jgi:regulator of RNase E activity RraB
MEAINIKAYPSDISQIEAIAVDGFKIQFEITK